jgi:tetratricopeptide (TPR) repeat protein
MSSSQPEKRRHLLPRWLASKTSITTGELTPAVPGTPSPKEDVHFDLRKNEWERERSVDVAAELVGSAIVLGRESEVEAAARMLAEATSDVSVTLREMAQQALGIGPKRPPPPRPSRPGRLDRPPVYLRISRLRHHLQVNPRDAYGWLDLGRLYAILGQNERALRPVQIALAIVPEDRLVLRTSARYFVHINQSDRAHRVLAGAKATASDPWLMAAEIAVSQHAELPSRMANRGQRGLKDDKWTHRSRSELAGSLATLFLEDGAGAKARQLFRESLVDPTENAVAQAQWAVPRTAGLVVPPQLFLAPMTHEARALHDYTAGQWSDALERCWDWQEFEPTSSRPTITGSYIAGVAFEDGDAMLEFTDRGLAAEPHNQFLLNNRAVGLIYQGHLAEAERLLLGIVIDQAPMPAKATLYATTGMLLFRSGDMATGRSFYEKAITHPHVRQDRRFNALALWHLAREEARSGTAETPRAIARAERASKDMKLAELDAFRTRIKAAAAAATQRHPKESR